MVSLRAMEQRQQPRISVPIEVDLNHASFGTFQTVTKDVSAGGIFARIPAGGKAANVPIGATMRVTLRNLPMIEPGPTPTVMMRVIRIDQDGLALEFANRSNEHLWNSVDRVRRELEVGRDLFQIHQSALVVSDAGQLLVVNDAGRWLFPGAYLATDAHATDAMDDFLQAELGIRDPRMVSPLQTLSMRRPASEATVFSIFYRYSASHDVLSLAADSHYRDARWVSRRMEIEELTFSDEALRPLAYRALALAEAQ